MTEEKKKTEKELNKECTFEKCDSYKVCKKLGMCRYTHHKNIIQTNSKLG